MITKETIENYAEIQGGLCLKTFSAREDEDTKKRARGYLNRRLEYLADMKRNLPCNKEKRVLFVISNYDIDSLLLEISQYAEERSNRPGLEGWSFRMGMKTAEAILSFVIPESERLSEEESEAFGIGMTLIALWNEAK